MKIRLLMLLPVLTLSAFAQQNLVINGSFDAPGDPLKGWNTDYAWTKNSHYVGNASLVVPMEQFNGQHQVVCFQKHQDAGVKMESVLIPYEQGGKYRASLKVQGGTYRVYFSGYQWNPGTRPHDNPTLPEMRPVYRSKTEVGQSSAWKTITLDIPGTEASELSLQHLKKVRFMTLYIFFLEPGYLDDVSVVKLK